MSTITREIYQDGVLVSTDTFTVSAAADNASTIGDYLAQSIAALSATVANWGNLTAAQKDQAALRAQRIVLRMLRQMYAQYDSVD